MAEKHVRVVQNMYDKKTQVRCAVGVTDRFKQGLVLIQGSALNTFLFAMVMNRQTDEVRKESLQPLMFADDTVI